LNSHIRRIPDHRVESPLLHDLRERPVPVKGVDTLHRLRIIQRRLHIGVDVRPDERVPALDILVETWQRPLFEEFELLRDIFLALFFEDLQEQRELSNLHGLGVDVHAVNVIQQDPFSLGNRQLPIAPNPRCAPVCRLVDGEGGIPC